MNHTEIIIKEYVALSEMNMSPPKTLVLSEEFYSEIKQEMREAGMLVEYGQDIPPTFYGMSLSVIDGQGVFLWKIE